MYQLFFRFNVRVYHLSEYKFYGVTVHNGSQ